MKKNPQFLKSLKERGQKIAALTAYDYPTARILNDAAIDFILVGDSLGMVVLGHPDTTEVTMEHMLHHTEAVARGAAETWVVADLPARSYETPEDGARNAARLHAAGADAVKVEGGSECVPVIEAILAGGTPLVGHLGMLPQRVRKEGGYRVKGRQGAEAMTLLDDARQLDRIGVSAIVLELVHAPLAAEITRLVGVPTIGIGSGSECDGQIRVLHDIIGLFPWFRPRFAKAHADVAAEIGRAAAEYAAEVRAAKH